MNNLCIIPARGGSKRIPRKNIKDFLGKPIIAYSIEVALESDLFEEVIVSTDDEEIALIAEKYGAKVPFIRSSEASNDYATLSDVIEEVKKQKNIKFKNYVNICCMLSTAPFIKAQTLIDGYRLFIEKQMDTLMTVTEYEFPLENAYSIKNNYLLKDKTFKKHNMVIKSKMLHDAGQFYWMNFKSALIKPDRVRGGIIVENKLCQDINTIFDWELAEFKYKKYFLNEK